MIVKSLSETLSGMWSLLVGMKVTAGNFKSSQITVHYPRQVTDLEGYRGHIELVPSDNDPTKSKCIACMNCVRICPGGCISITASKPKKKAAEEKKETSGTEAEALPEGKKEAPPKKAKPEPQSFVLDYNYCCLCGLCVESCPSGALRYSSDVYVAGFSRQEFVYDLLSRLQYQAQNKEQ
ncbi:4Fe-4S binding protein [Desulfonatronospira sp. MSAO_Bac3]|uniref:4Fe-4S binding protein n=1 Tax=Desulfonatronospira sp. MSAO_Bac3 TaxID=2293857 RepID=UPI000FF52091|nr:4Fe-4S binding protein [Desulfonatronospira sp. MSAO_Bac3]RQD78571.1 MAG: 4Fe-4S dicluster domain-containing protein [Desulfonatronospira sp. MSAO_Bac3]